MREAIVEVPPDAQYPAPVLIAMHGYGGNAESSRATRLAEVGQEHGLIVVYPDGWDNSWNAGACCGTSAADGVDDVGYLGALIDALVADYGADPNRVHLAGFSNGGMMALRFACEQADRVASISVVGGALGVADCAPSEPVSVLLIHSINDTIVPPQGGVTQGLSGPWVWPGVEETAGLWAQWDQCAAALETTSDAGLLDREWSECAGGARVKLLLTSDGAHNWPMGGDAQVDASAVIVSFAVPHGQD